GKDYIYKGETKFLGLHHQDELQLSNAQKKLFKKEKVKDLYPEMYLIKVNNFDDVAKNTLDEWIYFLKNSEIKKDFTAKGLKEAEEVLKVANMEDEERREYQRFGEVLSDRASQALSIKMEIEMVVENERKAKEKAIKQMEDDKIEIVANLLRLGSLTENQITEVAKVTMEFVEDVKKKIE
ncbi:MAG: hypothetical protein AAGK47_05540, partial [Bacteroidota bacterium]